MRTVLLLACQRPLTEKFVKIPTGRVVLPDTAQDKNGASPLIVSRICLNS